jgi:hypothetical protein
MGGVWERQIRSARNILLVLMEQSGQQLDDEALRTFMSETANIINSRPLCTENLNDPESLRPLTPNHILSMKSEIVLPPPGTFVREDLYLRKKWRRVQYMLNQFWSRWRKEFLHSLQLRQKWLQPQRNLEVGDIVLLKDDNLPRNLWPMCRVEKLLPSNDGFVRRVIVRLASREKHSSKRVTLERPIHKLILLMETEASPPKSP